MVGDKKDQSDKELEQFLSRISRDPRHKELMHQKVTLKTTGAEMPLQDAHGILIRLRDMQERKPRQFEALVAIVKPRGATRSEDRPSPTAIAALKKHGVIGSDGSPKQRIAAVLDAAYVETKEGVILRDPIIYPGREFADELARLDTDLEVNIGRAILDEIKDERRDKRRKDDGPTR